ncbi:MAG: ABC transporter substrate-binding protein [Micrococcales bacterium]|nr:ABC transporter substrate-binding protein [Micrococcales bacterium]
MTTSLTSFPRTGRYAVGALALALALGACSTGEAAKKASSSESSASAVDKEMQSATIGMSYIPDVQFSPWYVAKDKGILGNNGVNATIRHHGAQEGLFTALTSGKEQYLIAGADEMLQAKSQGMDLIAVAPYYRSYPVTLIVRGDSPAVKVADLKGKKIGVPGKYGESWFGLQVALKKAGLTEKDVTVQEIGYTQQAALTTKKVDAVVGYGNNDLVQFGLAGVEVRAIPLADEIPLVSVSLLTTAKQAKDNPELTKAVVKSLREGIEAVKADPDGAIAVSAKTIPGLTSDKAKKAAKGTLDATLKLMVDDKGEVSSTLDKQQFVDMAAFMEGQGLLKTKVDGASAMTTEYAE